MNNVATSKEELLAASIRLASDKGLEAINIREVARLCGISIGCVYNYFPSKSSLVAATVAKIWESIFHQADQCARPHGFCECVKWIYDSLHEGFEKYPSFFAVHNLGFSIEDAQEGRIVMDQFLAHMKTGLLLELNSDSRIRSDVFHDHFTKDDFIHFIFENLIMISKKDKTSVDYLLQIIQKLIY